MTAASTVFSELKTLTAWSRVPFKSVWRTAIARSVVSRLAISGRRFESSRAISPLTVSNS